MAGQNPQRADPGRRFNLNNSDYRPGRSTVADIVQELLDGAAANLVMARRMAGRAAGIPMWEELTRTWEMRNHRSIIKSTATQTSGPEEIGGAVTSRGTQTDPPTTAEPGQVGRWAVAATAAELVAHAAVQVALDRGVVTQPITASRTSRSGRRTTYSARLRSPQRARTHTAAEAVGKWLPMFPPEFQEDTAPRRTRSVQTKAQLKAVSQPPTPKPEPEKEEVEPVLQLSVLDGDLPDIDLLMGEIMSD